MVRFIEFSLNLWGLDWGTYYNITPCEQKHAKNKRSVNIVKSLWFRSYDNFKIDLNLGVIDEVHRV